MSPVSLIILSILAAPAHVTGSKRPHRLTRVRQNSSACDVANESPDHRVFVNPVPLTRIVSTCDEALDKICTIFEFRGYLHVYYSAEAGKSECHTIGLNLKSPIVQQQQPHVEDASDLELEASVIPDTGENPLNADKQPEVHRFLTTTGACCTKNIRCFSIPLSNGSMDENTLAGWHLFFTWLRTPESYEFGEEGWSSVGAPIGSLSGVYDLVRVRLVYVLRREAGFAVKDKADELRTFVVSSDSTERFQARVGDYYECTSGTDIVMTGENLTHTNKFSEYNLTQLYSVDPTWKPGLRVILSLTDVKAQAFADLNLPEFTGVGLLCSQDNSHDSTISIAIGLSICALVLLLLLGLAMSHLRDKDRAFKAVENME